jgi:hypothetical protein
MRRQVETLESATSPAKLRRELEELEGGGSELEGMSVESAYEVAKAEVERKARLWDWEENVDLIGVAKYCFSKLR